jgi:hypothetical protein
MSYYSQLEMSVVVQVRMLVTAQVRPMGYGPQEAARNSRVYHLYYGPHAGTGCRPQVTVQVRMPVTAHVRPMGYGPPDAARNSRVYHLYYGPHAETECRPHAHVRCALHVDRINVLCGKAYTYKKLRDNCTL